MRAYSLQRGNKENPAPERVVRPVRIRGISVKKAPPDKKAPPLNSRKISKGGAFLTLSPPQAAKNFGGL